MSIFQNITEDERNMHGCIVQCDCEYPTHQMKISWFKGDNDHLYFNFNLEKLDFIYRIGRAFKYLFGFKSIYGDYGQVLLNPEHIDKLIEQLERAKADMKIEQSAAEYKEEIQSR